MVEATNRFSGLYVSGSAYKIVNKRAYHHGTMLISTRLDTLGDLLRSDKVNEILFIFSHYTIHLQGIRLR